MLTLLDEGLPVLEKGLPSYLDVAASRRSLRHGDAALWRETIHRWSALPVVVKIFRPHIGDFIRSLGLRQEARILNAALKESRNPPIHVSDFLVLEAFRLAVEEFKRSGKISTVPMAAIARRAHGIFREEFCKGPVWPPFNKFHKAILPDPSGNSPILNLIQEAGGFPKGERSDKAKAVAAFEAAIRQLREEGTLDTIGHTAIADRARDLYNRDLPAPLVLSDGTFQAFLCKDPEVRRLLEESGASRLNQPRRPERIARSFEEAIEELKRAGSLSSATYAKIAARAYEIYRLGSSGEDLMLAEFSREALSSTKIGRMLRQAQVRINL
ncbi:MAG TPA: hypothetical protein VLJ37_03395 [bacterium]|nr:hypothetical protein [bacterium]